MRSEDCPKCIGSGEVMQGKEKQRGFEYKECNLCNGFGQVPPEIADDYVFAQGGESNFNNEE